MKILVMEVIRSLSDNAGTIHRYELIKNLSKLGNELYMLSVDGMSQKELFQERISICTIKENSKMIFFFDYLYKVLNLSRKERFDIVLVRAPLPGLIGVLIKFTFNAKLIYEINGIVPIEHKFESKYKRGQFFKKVFYKTIPYIDIYVAKRANAVRAITPEIMNYLVACGINREKIAVIGNGANTELFKPMNQEKTRNFLKLETECLFVGFSGSFKAWHGLEELIRSAPLVLDHVNEAKFLFIGDGRMKETIIKMADTINIPSKFIFLDRIDYKDMPQFINSIDVCIILKNRDVPGSPLKLWEYLACGKPVIATNSQDFKFLEEINAGILVNPEKPEAIANAILTLLKCKELREQMGRNGMKYVIENRSWENVAIEIDRICEKTIG